MNTAAELIALETAMRDLARLYETAVVFAPLRARAERDLLPRMNRLGHVLRGHLRGGQIGTEAIAETATELHALTQHWTSALDEVRRSQTVVAAIAAFQSNDQAALARLIPQLFAHRRPLTECPPVLHIPVAVTAARRRGTQRPFVTAVEAAEYVARLRAGIIAHPASNDWWEQALPAILASEEPALLDSPIALALDLRGTNVTIFEDDHESALLVYATRLVVPFEVELAREADDEWWAASPQPYAEFCAEVSTELELRGVRLRPLD